MTVASMETIKCLIAKNRKKLIIYNIYGKD